MSSLQRLVLSLALISLGAAAISQTTPWILPSGGKLGIQLRGKFILKPKYDTIIRVTEYCYITRRDGLYDLFCSKKISAGEIVKYKRYKLGSPSLIGSPGRSEFLLADRKTGLYASFNGYERFWKYEIKRAKYIYKNALLLEPFTIYQLADSRWMYPTKRYSSSSYSGYDYDTVRADTVIAGKNWAMMVKSDSMLWGERSMVYIAENGVPSSVLAYNPDFGKKKTVLRGRGEAALVGASGELLTPWCDRITEVPNGQYITLRNYKFGVIDGDGNTVMKNEHDALEWLGEGYLVTQDRTMFKDLYSLYDDKGVLCYGPTKHSIQRSCGALYRVESGVYNMNTKCMDTTIVSLGYDWGGIRRVDKLQSYYYGDTNCRTSPEFTAYREGYYAAEPVVATIFKMIFILPMLAEVLVDEHPFSDNYLSYRACYGGHFSDGMAYVTEVKGEEVRFGYIDESFSLVIPCIYEKARDFRGGSAIVSKDGKYGLISKTNQPLTEMIYRSYDYFGNGLIIVEFKKDFYHLIKTDGTRIAGQDFGWHRKELTGLLVRARDGKYYLVSADGEFVLTDQVD